MANDGEKFRGGNFGHFKTFLRCLRNGMVGHYVTCSHADDRRKLKNRGVLSNDVTAAYTTCSVKGLLKAMG